MSGHGEHGHSALALAALSGAEIVAALALLIPRLELVAAAALLAIFAIAAALTVAAGEAPLRFAYYAATAVAICAGARAPTPIAT
jgi:hypothetical protein